MSQYILFVEFVTVHINKIVSYFILLFENGTTSSSLHINV